MDAVKELTAIYRPERIVNITIIIFCAIIFIVCLIASLIRGDIGPVEAIPMFGSGGGIAALQGRLWHMFDKSQHILSGSEQ